MLQCGTLHLPVTVQLQTVVVTLVGLQSAAIRTSGLSWPQQRACKSWHVPLLLLPLFYILTCLLALYST
jgi:hypothetical protein